MNRDMMLAQATSFLESGCLLDEHREQAIPSLVCTAFGAEVALKAILCGSYSISTADELRALIKDRSPNGHTLYSLYGLLPADSQVRIKLATGDEMQPDDTFTLYAAPAHIASTMKRPVLPQSGEIDFDYWLRVCSNAFVDWRYSYEMTHLVTPGGFLRRFATACLAELTPPPAQTPSAPSPASPQS